LLAQFGNRYFSGAVPRQLVGDSRPAAADFPIVLAIFTRPILEIDVRRFLSAIENKIKGLRVNSVGTSEAARSALFSLVSSWLGGEKFLF